ncbi:MAG: hypothetical protein KDA25_02595 [Phycisphaerales bacterium]|nr:hypothetical protein [Phycisphaerales bacterium]
MLVDTSTLYAPSSVTLYWQPVSTTGLGLSAVAAKACEEACKALDAYCRAIGDPPSGDPYGYAGLTVPQLLAAASLALWQCENLLRDTLRRAGIT